MPLRKAFVADDVFQYTGSDDYENFYAFLSAADYTITRADCVLRSDGSVRFYSGGSQYSIIYPGQWLTMYGPLSSEQFATMAVVWHDAPEGP